LLTYVLEVSNPSSQSAKTERPA